MPEAEAAAARAKAMFTLAENLRRAGDEEGADKAAEAANAAVADAHASAKAAHAAAQSAYEAYSAALSPSSKAAANVTGRSKGNGGVAPAP